MSIEVKVPTLGESVTTATVARWMKKVGDSVAADEALVELETDKVTVEVNAPAAGVLSEIIAAEGAEVEVGALLGSIGAGAGRPAMAAPTNTAPGVNTPPAAPGPVARPADVSHAPLPAAAKLMADNNVPAAALSTGTGKDGRVTKGDVLDFLARPAAAPAAAAAPKAPRAREEGEERVKMTRLRKTLASRLKEAQNTAAMQARA